MRTSDVTTNTIWGLLGTLLLGGCPIGYDSIGDDEMGNASDSTGGTTTGDGDTGDGDSGTGSSDSGTGDGDSETDSGTGSSDTSSSDTSSSDTSSGDTSSDTSSSDSDTGDPPAAFELSLSQVKQFDFNWEPVVGAEYYQLLESVDIGDPYVQVGPDILGLSTSLTVPLHFRLNASYKLRSCDGNGCTDSDPVDVAGTLETAIGYFKASNTDADDWFGWSAALSGDGNTLAIGAYSEDSSATGIGGDQADNSAGAADAVYVFVRNGGVWSQQAYVKASNTNGGDVFGSSVTLSGDGNTLAVGAAGEDSNATGIDGNQADNSISDAGAVYVFVRNGGVWSQQAYAKASNPDANDNFGHALTLSGDGNTLAVGTSGEDSNATGIDGNQADNSLDSAGAVYVFVRDGADWSQQAYVKASNTDDGDRFARALTLSGDGHTLAVGAWGESSNATGIDGDQADNSAAYAGAVYVFVRNGVDWSQQAYVKASNTAAYDQFGWSVALSGDGNTLAVDASGEDSNATGIDGNQADNSLGHAGAVYVFVRDGVDWSQQAYVKASNTDAVDEFGVSVALSGDGNTLAVGSHAEDSNATGIGGNEADNSASFAGAAYVFVRDGVNWSQHAYVKASNTDATDEFGYVVALSEDGNTLAVGALGEDSSATGIGGDQADNSASGAGAVYLY